MVLRVRVKSLEKKKRREIQQAWLAQFLNTSPRLGKIKELSIKAFPKETPEIAKMWNRH